MSHSVNCKGVLNPLGEREANVPGTMSVGRRDALILFPDFLPGFFN